MNDPKDMDWQAEINAKDYFKDKMSCTKCNEYVEIDKELSFLDECSGMLNLVSKPHNCKYKTRTPPITN